MGTGKGKKRQAENNNKPSSQPLPTRQRTATPTKNSLVASGSRNSSLAVATLNIKNTSCPIMLQALMARIEKLELELSIMREEKNAQKNIIINRNNSNKTQNTQIARANTRIEVLQNKETCLKVVLNKLKRQAVKIVVHCMSRPRNMPAYYAGIRFTWGAIKQAYCHYMGRCLSPTILSGLS